MAKVTVPLHDKITVRKFDDSKEQHSKGGLILPEKRAEGTYAGEVIHVGPGKLLANGERAPMQTKPGDVVHFTRIAGVMHTIDGEDLVVMKEEDASVIVRGK